MGSWRRRPVARCWIAPEQVAAHRAAVAFIEWWKVIMEGPLHRAGELPTDLSLAAAEMTMSLAAARTQRHPRDRLRCFRVAHHHATRCAALLDAPELQELATAGEREEGRRLLQRFLDLVERLIRPPPDGGAPAAAAARPREASATPPA